MGGAAREPFPTMNLRQGAGSGFGREVGRLVGGPGAEQHCRLGVSVGTRGVKKRRGLGPLAVGEDEEEDQGGPVPAGLRGGGSRKQLTHTGPGWDMGACPPPVPASGGRGALPPEQVPKDWASVGHGWRCHRFVFSVGRWRPS